MTTRNVKRLALVAGGVLFLTAAGALLVMAFMPRASRRCPLELVAVSEDGPRFRFMPPPGFNGVVVATLRNTGGNLIHFDLGSYEVKTGDAWVKSPTPFFVMTMMLKGGGDPMSTNRSTHLMIRNGEAVRLCVKYCEEPSGWRPFGIGDYRARNSPSNAVTRAVQGAVRGVSQSLFDRMWPRPPVPGKNSPDWKTAIFEAPLPKPDTNDSRIARSGLIPPAILAPPPPTPFYPPGKFQSSPLDMNSHPEPVPPSTLGIPGTSVPRPPDTLSLNSGTYRRRAPLFPSPRPFRPSADAAQTNAEPDTIWKAGEP
jgi:hypothetical protein